MRHTIPPRNSGFALAVALLVTALLAVLLPFSARPQLETYLSGVAARIGYWGDWRTRFRVGESLQLLVDTSMPAGYQRIYLQQGGEIVGSLPDAAAARVRAALAAGHYPHAMITALDPLDPARGVRVGIAFERFDSGVGQSLARHSGGAPLSLL